MGALSTLKIRRIIRIVGILARLQDVIAHLLELMQIIRPQFMHIHSDLLVAHRRAFQGGVNNMPSADAVAEHHVQGRRGTAFLVIGFNRDMMKVRTAEKETLEFIRIAVVVEMDGFVGCEERVEVIVAQSVRMASFEAEHHQIGHIDDSDSKVRRLFPEHSGRFDDLEGEFRSDTHKHDIRIQPVVSTREFPDRGSGATMRLCFIRGEEDGLRLLGADHKIDVILRPETMSKRGQKGVCVGRKVDASGGGLEVQDGADEGRVLMGETVVFLSSPGTGFDVVDTANVFAPCSLASLSMSVHRPQLLFYYRQPIRWKEGKRSRRFTAR